MIQFDLIGYVTDDVPRWSAYVGCIVGMAVGWVAAKKGWV